MSIDLTGIPDDDLYRELQRRLELRQQEAARQAEEERKRGAAKRAQWFEHIDTLLTLVPEHDRTSCSDDNPANDRRECSRCVLLQMKRWGYWDEDATLEIVARLPRYEDDGGSFHRW